MALKDANLVMQQAQTAGVPMAVGQKTQELLQQGVANGLGDQDVVAVQKVISGQ